MAHDTSGEADSLCFKAPKQLLVLMIAPTPFYSGRGTHMRILHEAEALANRGHKIIIATYHIGSVPPGLHPNITVKRINRILFWYTKRSSGPNWQKLILDLLLCIKVLRISIQRNPEVLHCHLHEGVLIGWVVKKLLSYRKMILAGDFHGPLVGEMRSHGYLRLRPVQNFFNYIEKLIIRMPSCAFASSPGLKMEMDTERRMSDVCVLPDAPTFERRSASDLNVEDNRENPGRPSVIYTGGFMPDKGLETLYQVIALALKDGLSCRWIIAGGPRDQLELPPEIKNAVEVISPLGPDKLSMLLRCANVACDPKPGGMLQGSGKLLNYMAAGLPLVCFDGPAQRFYLGDELASRFTAKNVGHFFDILKDLLSLPAEERRNIRQLVIQRADLFSWTKSAMTLERKFFQLWQKERK
ncbi:MAG: glycosyltransferase [Desulfobacterales bacterium]|nr:glycosyltransferase [Desulfobacterales bacterium]